MESVTKKWEARGERDFNKNPTYLRDLTHRAAAELDGYSKERTQDLTNLRDYADVLGNYDLRDTDTAFTRNTPLLLDYWNVLNSENKKLDGSFGALAVELNLFEREIRSILDGDKRNIPLVNQTIDALFYQFIARSGPQRCGLAA